jgi:hypothetical protein
MRIVYRHEASLLSRGSHWRRTLSVKVTRARSHLFVSKVSSSVSGFVSELRADLQSQHAPPFPRLSAITMPPIAGAA